MKGIDLQMLSHLSPTVLAAAGGILLLLIVLLIFLLKRKKGKGTGEKVPQAELVGLPGNTFDGPLRIRGRITEVGRDDDRDISLPWETTSGLHAVIEFKDGLFWLEDQRSTNGTFLNGEQLEPNRAVRLKNGDQVTFDIYEFEFVIAKEGRRGQTVLRQATQPAQQPKQAPPIPTPTPKPPAGGDNATMIKKRMCPNHPSKKATELCLSCRTGYCPQCMMVKNGKDVCVNCAAK